MIWEITLLLTCFSVLTISPRAGQYFPGESSCSNKIAQEYLEELHDVEIVRLVSGMPTLDMTDFHFGDNDVRLLTTECNVDQDCLNDKKASVQKYHQKMQAIQCVNGLYVLNILDELKSIMVDLKYNNKRRRIILLRKPIKEYQLNTSSMLALLKLARWDAYAWQIEIFTFLSGLVNSDAIIELYVEHYENHNVSMRAKVSAFVNQCVQNNYLLSLNNTTTGESAVFQFVESMYKDNEVLKFPSLYYTVPNLMLHYLYLHDDFIFDWSMFEIELDTSNVKRQMRTHLGLYYPQDKIDIRRLDPIASKVYHTLIAKYIHLRVVYLAWFHLYTYHTLLDRLPNLTVQYSDFKELIGRWKALAPELKCILRAVGYDENIYWSGINIMMVDLKNISNEELKEREKFTRHYFCQYVEDLRLASTSEMNRQLQNIEIPKDYISISRSIQTNFRRSVQFYCEIERVSYPFKDSFIRILLGAERNETFVTR